MYPPIKLKQFLVTFIVNHINNFIDHAKIYMTLLVLKNLLEQLSQLLSTLIRFQFTALFCSYLIANAVILLTVSSLLTSLLKI